MVEFNLKINYAETLHKININLYHKQKVMEKKATNMQDSKYLSI
jgi:hypothetical protein